MITAYDDLDAPTIRLGILAQYGIYRRGWSEQARRILAEYGLGPALAPVACIGDDGLPQDCETVLPDAEAGLIIIPGCPDIEDDEPEPVLPTLPARRRGNPLATLAAQIVWTVRCRADHLWRRAHGEGRAVSTMTWRPAGPFPWLKYVVWSLAALVVAVAMHLSALALGPTVLILAVVAICLLVFVRLAFGASAQEGA